MDLFGVSGYGGLYGSNNLYGLNSIYGQSSAYGLSGIYGLNRVSGNSAEMASLYPAASYAKFSDALQKAAGGQQDLEKVFDRMQEDPAYKKEVLDLLQKGFWNSGLLGLKVAGAGTSAANVSTDIADTHKDRRVELYEQNRGQMNIRRGGSLADRLAANRSSRLSERDGSKHL